MVYFYISHNSAVANSSNHFLFLLCWLKWSMLKWKPLIRSVNIFLTFLLLVVRPLMAVTLVSLQKVSLAVCRWSVLLQMCAWLVSSVEPKKHNSTTTRPSEKKRLPAKTGKPPELCSAACSGSSAFGHVVPANWPPYVMPFIQLLERELCRLWLTVWGLEIIEGSRNAFEFLEDAPRNGLCAYSLCCGLRRSLYAELIGNARLRCCKSIV